ncbi:hypothetical protein DL240_11040 [Lujinxingia litoralis]|uniref:Aerotolerance regulator N-terminal domain-containing protein n=1 Tax=Lujinxingia litoralis TaxID=2211119 RepID=A0A328CAY8_9DELT|nr:BatA domain-containing protein [Lujinxingia litoralis]RAL22377.1 hypothetical protein DL240_11040 [Lujinxingia litoralis]
MNFVQPLFLVGLLAAALPLLIHLFNRRKAVRRPFPALRLLQASHQRSARSIKVRQRVLLALRMAAVAALALALAKPFFLSSSGMTAEERMPTAVALVIEDGLAMQHEGWMKRAREQASELVDDLRPWDQVVLVRSSGPDEERLTEDHGQVSEQLDELRASDNPGDLGHALSRASTLLSGSQLPNRRLVVIGSLTEGAFAQDPAELDIVHPLQLFSVRDEGDEPTPNLAITGVRYEQEGSGEQGAWNITATIANFGPDDATDVQAQLRVGDSVVGGQQLSVPAGQETRVAFMHRLSEPALTAARVELIDADELAADNTWHFFIRPREHVRALLINGSPSNIPYDDELFFLTRALRPGLTSESAIAPTTGAPERLERDDLNTFDVVVLANVARLNATQAERLRTYVEEGGGLFIAMGNQVDVEAYNHQLGELLPRPLRGLKRLAERDDPDAPIKITRLGQTRRQHPIFRVFNLPGGSAMQSVQVYSYMLLDPAPAGQQTTLALAYQDNAPALLERQVGQGRVLLWTTTLDREWTDLPVRTAYLPLMRRSLTHLARRASSLHDTERWVGAPFSVEVGDLVRERAIAVGPGGARQVAEPIDGDITLLAERPGTYLLYADEASEAGLIEGLSFAANLDRRASRLTPVPDAVTAAWQTDAEGRPHSASAPEARRRVNLWSWLLFFVTMALLAESVLGARRSVLIDVGRRILRGRSGHTSQT